MRPASGWRSHFPTESIVGPRGSADLLANSGYRDRLRVCVPPYSEADGVCVNSFALTGRFGGQPSETS
jgi:hypothetical protein